MTKTKTEPGTAVDRRSLLKGLTTGAAGTAAVLVAGAATVTPAAAAESDADKKKARYRVTDHVKAFYRTNRY